LFHAERQADKPTNAQTYGRKDGKTDRAKLIFNICNFCEYA